MPKFDTQKAHANAFPPIRYKLHGVPFKVALAPMQGKNYDFNGKGTKKPEPDVVAYTFPDLQSGLFKTASKFTRISPLLYQKLGLDKALKSTIVKFYVRDYFHKHFDQHPVEIPLSEILPLLFYNDSSIDFPCDYLEISWHHLVGSSNAPFRTVAKSTTPNIITLIAKDPSKCGNFQAKSGVSTSKP